MVDNVEAASGSGGPDFATAEVTWSSDLVHAPASFLFGLSGSEGSYTIAAINGTAANGLEVDVTQVQGTVTVDLGDNNDVTMATLPDTTTGDLAAMVVLLGTIDTDTGVIAVDTTSIDGKITACDTGAVVLSKTGSVVDADNSSTANLGNGGVFEGTATDCQGYAAVCINLFADEDGASDGMTFQFCSNDTFGADVDTYAFNMTADQSRRFQFPVTARYFRVRYTNGTTPTTDLDIQTILHPVSPAYTSIHKIEDSVSVDRSAELVKAVIIAQVNGTGDFIPIQANASGILKIGGSVELDTGTNSIGDIGTVTAVTAITNALPIGDNNIGNVDIASSVALDVSAAVVTVDLAGNNDVVAAGDVAHATADSGNPIKIGAKATNDIEGITQVAANARVNLAADLNGCVITRPYTTPEEILSERVSNTDGASTAFSTFGSGGPGTHNYVTTIVVHNSSATNGYVDIRDGTAGNVLMTIPLPATAGAAFSLPVPLKSSADTALAFDVSAALSTVYISLVGYQAKG